MGDTFKKGQDEAPESMAIDSSEDSFEKTFDINVYSSWYEGPISVKRLVFLGMQRPSLQIEALTLAEILVRKSFDVATFENIRKFCQAASEDALNSMEDSLWSSVTLENADLKEKQLLADLTLSRKEKVSVGISNACFALGDHYVSCGDLRSAFKHFSNAANYCEDPVQTVTICNKLIIVCILEEAWMECLDWVIKAFDALNATSNTEIWHAKHVKNLQCAKGLAFMGLREYKIAADSFLQVEFKNFNYPELLSARDVAYYAGLSCLATYDRDAIFAKCLSNKRFKDFLTIDQNLFEAIHLFYNRHFLDSLKNLEIIRNNFNIDLFLSSRVDKLFVMIKKMAMIQYFAPYLTTNIWKMANAFGVSPPVLVEELIALIQEGRIEARIDSVNHFLCRKTVDKTATMYERAINLGKSLSKTMSGTIILNAIIKKKIVFKE